MENPNDMPQEQDVPIIPPKKKRNPLLLLLLTLVTLVIEVFAGSAALDALSAEPAQDDE